MFSDHQVLRRKALTSATKINEINHSERTAKQLYYEKRLEQLNSNVKRTCSLLNETVNRKLRSRHVVSSFQADSQGVSDPIQLTCFKNIGPNLAEKVSNPQEVL